MRVFAIALASLVSVSTLAFPAKQVSKQVMRVGTKVTLTIDVDDPQSVSPKADIIFVVDNSGSMYRHQQVVAANVHRFITGFAKAGVDMHAGILTTSMHPNVPTGGGKFIGGYFESRDPDFNAKVANAITVGINGSGIEEHFSPVVTSLTEPLISTTHTGFLREDAHLIVVFVTDADDQSALSAADFTAFLKALKGGDATKVHLAAVIVPTNAPATCDRAQEPPPVKIEMALKLVIGQMISLCSEKLGDELESLSFNLLERSSFSRTVTLPSAPIVSSIKVAHGTWVLPAGDVEFGWAFLRSKNALQIGDHFDFSTQPHGTPLVIEYLQK